MERNLCLDWPALVQEAVARRKQRRFTQEQMAVLAGVSKPTLNAFEQGKTSLSLSKAFSILTCVGLVRPAEGPRS